MTPAQEELRTRFIAASLEVRAFLLRESCDKDSATECAGRIHRAIWAYVGWNYGLQFSGMGQSQSAVSVRVVPKSRKAIAALERLERKKRSAELWYKAWLEMPAAAFFAITNAAAESGKPLDADITEAFPFLYRDLTCGVPVPAPRQIMTLIPRAKELARKYVTAGKFDRDSVLMVIFWEYCSLQKSTTRKGAARFVASVEACYRDVFTAIDPEMVKEKSIFGGLQSKATQERIWQPVKRRIDSLAN